MRSLPVPPGLDDSSFKYTAGLQEGCASCTSLRRLEESFGRWIKGVFPISDACVVLIVALGKDGEDGEDGEDGKGGVV
jgi:hypothetical protein